MPCLKPLVLVLKAFLKVSFVLCCPKHVDHVAGAQHRGGCQHAELSISHLQDGTGSGCGQHAVLCRLWTACCARGTAWTLVSYVLELMPASLMLVRLLYAAAHWHLPWTKEQFDEWKHYWPIAIIAVTGRIFTFRRTAKDI